MKVTVSIIDRALLRSLATAAEKRLSVSLDRVARQHVPGTADVAASLTAAAGAAALPAVAANEVAPSEPALP